VLSSLEQYFFKSIRDDDAWTPPLLDQHDPDLRPNQAYIKYNETVLGLQVKNTSGIELDVNGQVANACLQ